MSEPDAQGLHNESPPALGDGDLLAWEGGAANPADPSARPEHKREQSEADRETGEQSWRNLLLLDAQVFEQRGIRLLTPEARLLINLKLSGTLTVTEAMEMAGVSYRGFYAVLERLKRAGLVGQAKDRTDQRVRNLRLEPSTPIPPAEL